MFPGHLSLVELTTWRNVDFTWRLPFGELRLDSWTVSDDSGTGGHPALRHCLPTGQVDSLLTVNSWTLTADRWTGEQSADKWTVSADIQTAGLADTPWACGQVDTQCGQVDM